MGFVEKGSDPQLPETEILLKIVDGCAMYPG